MVDKPFQKVSKPEYTMNEKEAILESHHKKKTFTKKVRSNPWMASTIVLAVFALILIIVGFSGFKLTGNVISEGEAKNTLITYLDSAGANIERVEIIDISIKSGLYEILFDYEGQPYPIPFYITKDGKFVGQLTSLVVDSAPADTRQEIIDWSVFENEVPSDIKSKILSFTTEELKEYDSSFGINYFVNYELIPKTLLVFYSSDCGWCSKYYPVLVEAKEKYPEITIYALVLNDNRNLAEKYGITGTPANVVNGKYLVSGYRPLEDLSEILDKLN